MKQRINVFWFRRDLRLYDNAALYHSLKEGVPVLPIFIFDKQILDKLEDKADRRVAFIHSALEELQQQLAALNSSLLVIYGYPTDVFKDLIFKYTVAKVFANHDYDPYAKERDKKINEILKGNCISFNTSKDQVIFEKSEILKDNGSPYTVFTPYSRKWKSALNKFYLSSYPAEKYFQNFYKTEAKPLLHLESFGFQKLIHPFPSKSLVEDIVKKYSDTRDFPGVENGTSKLGVHLRFGTVSIRELARMALGLNDTYLNELIWREFYQMILWHFPKVGEGYAFKPEYEKIDWRNNEGEFEKWCAGMTGYPIVDAGMRELNATGFMHNRVRMVVASFLTKHLLIDWRWGESYFAQKLLDYDLASNNGGWQWAGGSGCDAAPFFRIFNPHLQTIKFDKGLRYINKWVPELNEVTYPKPIVEHDFARKRALEVYGKALKK
ncbi:deoxyribodipyrimidine photo-lyase [Segetibacter sp.]|uniref:cryptochrome/photolyase family protein n=1 Tax=Segetibacter sp. TaxID=2231182 RepID=UPI00261CAAD5|nr:deoxyribodipyrimidine photo-lyase [Segetibacter sp.]MCW3082001.1 deoxyribodipyrimidine photo-lyase [Segetibacter sp.]